MNTSTECKGQFTHRWYSPVMGGARCSRCSESHVQFSVIKGQIVPKVA